MWVRGLKQTPESQIWEWTNVAPHVGAWIETHRKTIVTRRGLSHPMWVRGLKLVDKETKRFRYVAPHVGAWIETKLLDRDEHHEVAPHVGAWIETALDL